jgi:hypothetical protein
VKDNYSFQDQGIEYAGFLRMRAWLLLGIVMILTSCGGSRDSGDNNDDTDVSPASVLLLHLPTEVPMRSQSPANQVTKPAQCYTPQVVLRGRMSVLCWSVALLIRSRPASAWVALKG